MPGTKKYAGGWEFDIWDETLAYDQGDVVALGTYLYKAAVATSAGEKPGVATYSFPFTDTARTSTPPGDPEDIEYKTLPKWILWDLGADYYYGLLRGVALTPEQVGLYKFSSSEVRTLVVRSSFVGSSTTGSDEHLYDLPDYATYAGYGFDAGMSCDWPGGIYAPSAVPFDTDGNRHPEGYFYNLGEFAASFIYQPSLIVPTADTAYWDAGGLDSDPRTAMVFSIYGSFGRDFSGDDGTMTIAAFADNWTANPGTGDATDYDSVSPTYQST